MKPFGDLVLNYLKKLHQSHNSWKKQLRFALYVQPIAILIVSFAGLIVTTDLFLHYFIDSQIDQRIQQQFAYLDQKYQNKDDYQIASTNLFEASYLILDKNSSIVFSSNGMNNENSQLQQEEILDYLHQNHSIDTFIKENNNSAQNSDAHLAEIGDDHYFLDIKQYEGQLNGVFISNSTPSEVFTVVSYVRTTPLLRFVILINCVLVFLSFIICLLAGKKYYVTSKQLQQSFEQIEENLLKTGNRQLSLPLQPMDYQEFNHMQETIEKMDQLIADGEERQKLFFQNASHELRTPLMSIQGYAESIRHGYADQPQEAAAIIFDESQKMKTLVNEILLLSKIDSQVGPMTTENLSLTDLIYDISWSLQINSKMRNIQFEHRFDADYIEINANEEYLRTAISNILSNALRYATSKIIISIESSSRPLKLTISNDGEPISDQDLPHIFERFYKGKGGQTGIGLALTKEIIEKHHGKLSVSSTERETSFQLLLP